MPEALQVQGSSVATQVIPQLRTALHGLQAPESSASFEPPVTMGGMSDKARVSYVADNESQTQSILPP